jgi:formylglycine-generating enzyme required for sulfatase activity
LPALTQLVPEFEIGRFPVTRGDFLAWIMSSKCGPLPEVLMAYWRRFASKCDYDDDAPIVTVTLMEAAIYCSTQSARLPYRLEWVRAAMNSDDRSEEELQREAHMIDRGHWGLADDWSQDGFSQLVSVQRSNAPSWCEAEDMLGNADEFTFSPASFSPHTIQILGEFECQRRMSYMRCGVRAPVVHPAYSHWIVPNLFQSSGDPFRPTQIGFRMARDLP